jgi:hypothetical protein
MKKIKVFTWAAGLSLLATTLSAQSATGGIADDPGMSNATYNICNNPAQTQGGTTSYSPDENNGATWFNSNWKCTWGTSSTWLGSEGLAVGAFLTLTKNDLQTPTFMGNGSFPRSLSKVEWDFTGDGVWDSTDNGPWPTWKLTRGHPYVRGQQITGQTSFSTPGNKTLTMKVTYDDATSQTVTGTVSVVADAVSAEVTRSATSSIVSDPNPVLTGKTAYFSAAGSGATSGSITKYEWDLNGDGSFETNTGSSPLTSTSWSSAGLKSIGLRVTAPSGATATKTLSVDVRLAPPTGSVGFSINDGSSFTNNSLVSIHVVWPANAKQVRISNDGGFATSRTQVFDLSNVVSWTLDTSVPGVFTKNVYAKFIGEGVDTVVYSDDIIFDNAAPVISSATATSSSGRADATLMSNRGAGSNVLTAKVSYKVVAVKISARDSLSGVSKIEISSKLNKSGGKVLTYKSSSKLRIPASRTIVYLRVQDKAGNWSPWRTVKVKTVRKA